MDARLFRYLFENTSKAIIMTGCTWDKGAQDQIRYTYSSETNFHHLGMGLQAENRQMLYGGRPIDLFVMGNFSIEDAKRLIYAIYNCAVKTVVIPYVTPIHRFFILQTLVARGIEDREIIKFIQAPYLYMEQSPVKRFYFIYGNGNVYEKSDRTMYAGYNFESQSEEILDMIEEMEGYRIPVKKAGYIIDNRMLFYFGHFGMSLQTLRHFVHHYAKSGKIEKFDRNNFDDRQVKKMLFVYQKEFGDNGMDSLTMFCSPIEIIATQTDCVLNTIVIDKDDFCHADIQSDDGRCTLKCMLYNDYDVCRCHRTENAELRAGLLLLGNIKLSRHMEDLRKRYGFISNQIRAITLPNSGNINNWDSSMAALNAKKNAVFWICPLQAQTPDRVLREIKSANARYRIVGLNEEYGCCFNGFLTEKIE
ncbi:MAG: hypothetical protein HFH30_02230 [Eubacterium sp.]|nr:hypothetical protein [Eubacterium sp.]MCI8919596.1 hypothetical protein [Eubacterium sp.]